MASDTKYYELSYIAPSSLNEEGATLLDESLRALLASFDATIDSWDSPKQRRLAHSIDKATEAFFGALRFTAPRTEAVKINESMKKAKHIMRFMLLEWRKAQPRRAPRLAHTVTKEEQLPTDEKALDERLEEIFGETIGAGDQPNESK